MEFNPFISRKLLMKSLNHARNYIDIINEEIDIILTCRKSDLTDNKRTWVKSYIDNFDVRMGSYDLA